MVILNHKGKRKRKLTAFERKVAEADLIVGYRPEYCLGPNKVWLRDRDEDGKIGWVKVSGGVW